MKRSAREIAAELRRCARQGLPVSPELAEEAAGALSSGEQSKRRLSVSDLRARFQVGSRTTIYRWMQSRGFPKPIQGSSRLLWREEEVEAWETGTAR